MHARRAFTYEAALAAGFSYQPKASHNLLGVGLHLSRPNESTFGPDLVFCSLSVASPCAVGRNFSLSFFGWLCATLANKGITPVGTRFRTRAQVRVQLLQHIELFNNPKRRHSSLEGMSPVEFEKITELAQLRVSEIESTPG